MSDFISYNGRQFPVVNGDVARRKTAALPAPTSAASPNPKRKYGNRHVIIGSERFDSEKEGRRHLVLLDMQKRGEIENLKRQVWFKLIVNGELIGKVRPDWTYRRTRHGRIVSGHLGAKVLVAEDAKGYQTPDHKTRWKLAKALHPEIEWRLS